MAALKSARPRLVKNFESPARAELGLAIAARNALISETEAMAATYETFESAVWRAQEAEEAAELAVAQAVEATAQHAVARLHNPDAPAPMTPKEARAALDDARDQLETARRTRDLINEKLRVARDFGVKEAEAKVSAAASAVVLEALDINALIDHVTALQKDLLRAGGVLTYLANKNIITDKTLDTRINKTELDNRIFAAVARLNGPPIHWRGILQEDNLRELDDYGARTWGVAIEALKHDANAPLPVGANITYIPAVPGSAR